MTTDRPIIFKAPMIRAILDGQKTQTRRIMKPQPYQSGIECKATNMGAGTWRLGALAHAGIGDDWKCPYGVPGEQLWVRETHCFETNFNLDVDYDPPFNDGRPIKRDSAPEWGEWWTQCHYRATDPTPDLAYDDVEGPHCRWRSSTTMPKWAARIWLEITSVRVERVQDISKHDCFSEGVTEEKLLGRQVYPCPKGPHAMGDHALAPCPERAFAAIWDDINGSGAWDRNDWVWVIEFRRV